MARGQLDPQPRGASPPGSRFTIEIHVAGELGNPAEQGGLLVYVDDDNYIKLVKERVGPQRTIVMVTETAGVPVVDGSIDIEADEAWLQIEASIEARDERRAAQAVRSGGSLLGAPRPPKAGPSSVTTVPPTAGCAEGARPEGAATRRGASSTGIENAGFIRVSRFSCTERLISVFGAQVEHGPPRPLRELAHNRHKAPSGA